jgi:DIS3-like exonuclease 1
MPTLEEAAYLNTRSTSVETLYHYGLGAAFRRTSRRPFADMPILWSTNNYCERWRSCGPSVLEHPEVSSLCDHINVVHRGSKQAQRESSNLFQSLYFAKYTQLEDAIIYDVREPGFHMFLPRFFI